jgi:hypothetical protein
MSTTTISDTQTTDNNDDIKEQPTFFGKIVQFFISLIIILIIISGHITCGSLVLYGCKISQSNILPKDINCYPYTDTKPNIQNISTNIFPTFTDPPLSMKLNIPYNEINSKNILIDILRNYKNDPSSGNTLNYFVSIIESLLSLNYSAVDMMLSLLNYLPESLIILLGPIIMSIFSVFLFLFDNLYVMYLWFSKMSWFFKKNVNTDNDSKPRWEDVTIIEPISYWWSICKVFLFFILFFVVLCSALPFLPLFTVSCSLLSLIGYEGKMNEKKVTSINIVKDVFKYYKILFMSLFSFFVITTSFANLGVTFGIISFVVLLFIIFGVVTINTFKPKSEENLSPLVSSLQAKRSCSLKNDSGHKHGLLYNLFFSQNGGKQLVKDLKQIGKTLNKN